MKNPNSKKSIFSRVMQIGVVVRDMDKATEFYESLGIGPFIEGPSATVTDRRIYGELVNNNDVKIIGKIAQLGPIEFELLQPIAGKSIQKEFLDSKGEGVIHICSYTNNINEDINLLEERGFPVISSGKLKDGGRFAYIDTRRVGGFILELYQPGTVKH